MIKINVSEYRQLISEHPELSRYFEYVEGSRGREGYWRRIPKTRFRPTRYQKMHRLRVIETAYKLYDKNLDREGFLKEMTRRLKGKRVAPPKTEKIIKDLVKTLKEIGVRVEEREEKTIVAT